MISSAATLVRPAAPGITPSTPLPAGPIGLSAYDVAVANGFTGSQFEWLASLVGPPADTTALNAATGESAQSAAIAKVASNSATTAAKRASDASALANQANANAQNALAQTASIETQVGASVDAALANILVTALIFG